MLRNSGLCVEVLGALGVDVLRLLGVERAKLYCSRL